MLKVPALFFLTLIVTLPSLYVFNALVGSRLTLSTVIRLLVAALGVMLAVLASLGPIVAFFSVSTTSYPFMVLLNVVVFAASGFLGLAFLLQTLHRLSLAATARPRRRSDSAPPASEASPAVVEPPGAPRPARRPGAGPSRQDGFSHLGRRLRPGRCPDELGPAPVRRRPRPARSPGSGRRTSNFFQAVCADPLEPLLVRAARP